MERRTSSLRVLACLGILVALPVFAAGEADPVAKMMVSGPNVWFDPLVPNAGFMLSVVAPDGTVQESMFAAGETPFVNVSNQVDGVYNYELRVVPIGVGTTERVEGVTVTAPLPPVQTGSFQLAGGEILSKANSNVIETPAALSEAMDQIIADSLTLQHDNTRVLFDDTSTLPGFPANDWQLTANDSVSGGASYFAIQDITAGTVPFRINAGAPNNALFVQNNGYVGIGTSIPAWALHLSTNDTPAIRFQQTPGPWPASAFDIRSHEGGIWFNDVSGSGADVFRIEHGAPAGAFRLNAAGYVGLGLASPVRQLHLWGANATFRMDREANTAAFILCRTNGGPNSVWKSYIVGTDGFGVNNGQFIIGDAGTGAGGAYALRMQIQNDGTVVFPGNVFANSFTPTSSIAFKTNVRTLDSAMDLVSRLRGVRFDWKSTGEPSVGLIAEEVETVIPEVVSHDGNSQMKGVNYSSLVAVLVEAVKSQKQTIDNQQESIAKQQQELSDLKSELEKLKSRLR